MRGDVESGVFEIIAPASEAGEASRDDRGQGRSVREVITVDDEQLEM
jgi:hypothetical protein